MIYACILQDCKAGRTAHAQSALLICAIRCPLDPVIRGCDDLDYLPMICGAMIENTAIKSVTRDSSIIPIHGSLHILVDPFTRLVEENLRVG